jgi:sugar phosphate isomerase/epimerase
MGYDIGVSSIIYQDRSAPEMAEELRRTEVDAVEISLPHLNPDTADEVIDETVGALSEAGIDVCGYGVVDLERPDQVERELAFADRIGGEYVTVNYPPAREDITSELVSVAEARDLSVGIHNYSTVHHDDLSEIFSTVGDLRRVLDAHQSPNLGVCVDTGHFLVMEESPRAVIPELGPRINSVHLKDTSDAEVEDVPGRGVLDLAEFVELLDEHVELTNPLIIEYEIEENVTEGLIEAERALRETLQAR